MKFTCTIFLFIIFNSLLNAQQSVKNYGGIITNIEWTPNGKAMVLSIIKLDSAGKQKPGTKAYWYDIRKQEIEALYDNGGAGTVSPDGKTIAFARRKDGGKSDIYLYNRTTKKETALVVDTVRLFGPVWSSDGKKIAFNSQLSRAAPVQILVVDVFTKQVNQVIADEAKNYNPRWSTAGNTLAYFKEKGDKRDQIYLTDEKGTYHKNITNDTTTHNYYPDWMGANTIIYTQDGGKLMMINANGTGKRELKGAQTNSARYNAATGKLAYISEKSGGTITVFDVKKKTTIVLLSGEDLKRYDL